MELQAYSIYDSAAKNYNNPFFVNHVQQAIRALTAQVKDPATNISHFPEDYTLFHIGSYDSSTGLIKPLQANVRVINARDLLTSLEKENETNKSN